MSRSSIERRLRALTPEIQAARDEVGVIDEQLLHFVDSAEEARLRSLVSETPQATREHRHAARTVANLQNDRQKWMQRLQLLESQQDDLLDKLMEDRA